MLNIHLSGGLAWAEESTKEWRAHWDEIMLWINFAILAFVLIKFLRKPIKDFLDGRKYELAREIKKVEEEKQAIEEKIKELKLELIKNQITSGKGGKLKTNEIKKTIARLLTIRLNKESENK